MLFSLCHTHTYTTSPEEKLWFFGGMTEWMEVCDQYSPVRQQHTHTHTHPQAQSVPPCLISWAANRPIHNHLPSDFYHSGIRVAPVVFDLSDRKYMNNFFFFFFNVSRSYTRRTSNHRGENKQTIETIQFQSHNELKMSLWSKCWLKCVRVRTVAKN